jgi:hypothetical protein
MSKMLGQAVDFLINDQVLACAKGVKFRLATKEVECTNPNSGIHEDYEPVTTGYIMTATHLYTSSAENFQQVFELANNHTTFQAKLRRADGEGYQYYANAFILGLDYDATLDVPIGFNLVMRIKGKLTSEEILNFWIDELDQFIQDENDNFILI